jgi:hypothetical protein
MESRRTRFRRRLLRPTKDGKGITISPKMFLDDFREVVASYFKHLSKEGEKSRNGRNFDDRFDALKKQRSKR